MNWLNFTVKELACRHCGVCHMDAGFMKKLERVRLMYGRAMIPTSGYRCSDYNEMTSSSGTHGPHTTGRAVDIRVYGSWAVELLEVAISHGLNGIGVMQKGDYYSRFLHLDDLRPRIWTY